jgi:hypothetical protein
MNTVALAMPSLVRMLGGCHDVQCYVARVKVFENKQHDHFQGLLIATCELLSETRSKGKLLPPERQSQLRSVHSSPFFFVIDHVRRALAAHLIQIVPWWGAQAPRF